MAGQADLPEGVWSLILSFCDSQSVVRFGATCHRNKQRANDELVWKPRVESALGSGVATEPSSWRCESYQQLFTRFLRVYAPLLGAWNGQVDPLGSLLVVHAEPPYIVGSIVASLRFGEPGASGIPIFRIGYDTEGEECTTTCLRGTNTFAALHMRSIADAQGQEQPDRLRQQQEPHEATLVLEYDTLPYAVQGEHGGGKAGGSGEYGGGGSGSESMYTVSSGGEGQEGGQPEVGSTPSLADSPPQPSSPQLSDDRGGGSGQAEHGGGAAAADAAVGGRRTALAQKLKGFSFGCGRACRQHEVEAVCRWDPSGLMPLPQHALRASHGPQQQRLPYVGRAGQQGAGAAAAAAAAAAGPSGQGQSQSQSQSEPLVDLDVVRQFDREERVMHVAWTMQDLFLLPSYRNYSPVSYRRLTRNSAVPKPPGAPPPSSANIAATEAAIARMAAPAGPVQATAASASTSAAAASAATEAAALAGPAEPTAVPAEATVAADAGMAASAGPAEPTATTVAAGGGIATGHPLLPPQLVAAPAVWGVPSALAPRHEPHTLEGLWRGTYGPHGIEVLRVRRAGPHLLVSEKLTGDANIPAGCDSFRIHLLLPGEHSSNRPGGRFVLPPGYSSRVQLWGAGAAAAGGGGAGGAGAPGEEGVAGGGAGGLGGRVAPAALCVLASYVAEGQVASTGYVDPSWIAAEAVVFGRDTFGLLWKGIHSFSVFRRLGLELGE